MIFTLLCIKEFVKNFPFVNKTDPKEDPIKDTKKDIEESTTEGLEKNT